MTNQALSYVVDRNYRNLNDNMTFTVLILSFIVYVWREDISCSFSCMN